MRVIGMTREVCGDPPAMRVRLVYGMLAIGWWSFERGLHLYLGGELVWEPLDRQVREKVAAAILLCWADGERSGVAVDELPPLLSPEGQPRSNVVRPRYDDEEDE